MKKTGYEHEGKRTGYITILIMTMMLFSTVLTILPVSQHTEAATSGEMLSEAKTVYPVLQNPSFETGDMTGWDVTGSPNIVYGGAADGSYYIDGGRETLYQPSPAVCSGLVLVSDTLRYYLRVDAEKPSYSGSSSIVVVYYNAAKDSIGSNIYWEDISTVGNHVWAFRERKLSADVSSSVWNMTKYVSVTLPCNHYFYSGSMYYWGYDAVYLGDYHNTTNMLTINSADTTTVQSQNEYISIWAVNSYGSSFNDVKISATNYPLKSLAVDCVGITGNSIGYMGAGMPHYIQLGIESPSTVGLYSVNIQFIYYNTYAEEIGRETFTIQVSNIAVQVNTLFDKTSYDMGQTCSLTLKNNMDRSISINIYAWYESSMFLYGDTPYTLGTGNLQTLTINLFKTGKYTFEFRIHYEEILMQRELCIRKQIYLTTPGSITSKHPSNIYSVPGDTTFDYSLFTNSTELSNYKIYVRVTYPDTTTNIFNKTVYNGLYEHYFLIPVPAVNYSSDNFKIEIYRQINTTTDIQYGTGTYLTSGGAYDDGLKVWEHTYTIHEGAAPLIVTGWDGVGDYTMYLIIALIAGVILIAMFGYIKAFKGGKR